MLFLQKKIDGIVGISDLVLVWSKAQGTKNTCGRLSRICRNIEKSLYLTQKKIPELLSKMMMEDPETQKRCRKESKTKAGSKQGSIAQRVQCLLFRQANSPKPPYK